MFYRCWAPYKVESLLPPLREKSAAAVEGLAVFFNGNGGGMSGSSTMLPFLLGNMGGTSWISGSLLSIDSNNKIIIITY